MSSTPVDDYYSILGVARDASADEIKRNFRRLARECHPDVAGDDPETVARFTRIREAYETLSDPKKRDAYDNPPRRTAGGMFYRKRWRPPGGHHFDGLHHGDANATPRRAAKTARERLNDPNNNLDLEDIFSDLGSAPRKKPSTARGRRAPDPRDTVRSVGEGLRDMMNNASAAPPGPGQGARSSQRTTPRNHTRHRREAPPGEDIMLTVDVPGRVARSGGTITVSYPRHKRGERSDTLFRYSEIHDLRVPSGVRDGHTLRVTKMGHAGASGGPYGDLVCQLRLVHDTPPKAAADTRTGRGTGAAADDDKVVPISLVEALLGGRVDVDTPGGRVRITVPAGTSSGTRMRLRGRGERGGDLFVRLRIVVPRTLDDESRALIERFAALNPDSPRR